MKKDYLWFTVIGLLVFGFGLDKVSGPLALQGQLRNPYQLIQPDILSQYPLTAVSILAKAVALSIFMTLGLGYLTKKPLLKASLLFVIAGLAQLYAIQQIATRGTVTPIEWTLGIAFAGVVTLLPILILLIQGLFFSAKNAIIKDIKPIQHDLRQPPSQEIND